jgi:hypothetical protein
MQAYGLDKGLISPLMIPRPDAISTPALTESQFQKRLGGGSASSNEVVNMTILQDEDI